MPQFRHILVTSANGVETITLNRPDKRNALCPLLIDELTQALSEAEKGDCGVVILTGAGPAFCAGLDMEHLVATQAHTPEDNRRDAENMARVLRTLYDFPKPVIAAVNGVAIGGGHVIQVLCDLTIAAEHATFGQAGPRVGSFDAGFGTAYLARILGEKRAREVWYLCRQYSAETMERWGLVNAVVPGPELRAEVRRWADEILEKSPTALRVLKHSFNADSESIAGLGTMSFDTLALFVNSDEAREGVQAFTEKRPPDFSDYR